MISLLGAVVTGALLVGCTTTPPAPVIRSSAETPRVTPTPRVAPSSAGAARTSPQPRGQVRGRLRTDYYAIDGDSLRRGDQDVRVIGIDTPEYGECGFEQARAATAGFISRGIRLVNRSGRDRYGRVLAYVESGNGRDLGTMLIRRGLANARYDSTDGYPWHPHQNRYRRLDRRTAHICGRRADSLGGPEPFNARGGPFPDCDTARSAGAAPLRRGDSGWNPDLDGDGDGIACE